MIEGSQSKVIHSGLMKCSRNRILLEVCPSYDMPDKEKCPNKNIHFIT